MGGAHIFLVNANALIVLQKNKISGICSEPPHLVGSEICAKSRN